MKISLEVVVNSLLWLLVPPVATAAIWGIGGGADFDPVRTAIQFWIAIPLVFFVKYRLWWPSSRWGELVAVLAWLTVMNILAQYLVGFFVALLGLY